VPEVLWDIGKNCVLSLLDLVENNPISRVVPAGYSSLALLHLELVNSLEIEEEVKREKKLKRVKSSFGEKKKKRLARSPKKARRGRMMKC